MVPASFQSFDSQCCICKIDQNTEDIILAILTPCEISWDCYNLGTVFQLFLFGSVTK